MAEYWQYMVVSHPIFEHWIKYERYRGIKRFRIKARFVVFPFYAIILAMDKVERGNHRLDVE